MKNHTKNRIQFEAILDSVLVLSASVKDELWTYVKVINYNKGDFILEQGKVEKHISFLSHGMIRAFQNQDEGEITLDFRFSPNLITAYTSYISEKPTDISIQALKDSVVLKIHKSVIEKLYVKHHQFETMGRLIAESFYLRRIEREVQLLTSSAEERYVKLLSTHPEYIQHIPVKYLATYLGIHPKSLSRIRAKIIR